MFFPPLFMRPLGPGLATWPWPLLSTDDFYEVAGAHNKVPAVVAALLEVLEWSVAVEYSGPDAPAFSLSAVVPAGTNYFKNVSAGIETVGNSPGWESPSHIFERHHHPDAVSGEGDYSLNVYLMDGLVDDGVDFEVGLYTALGVNLGFVEDDPEVPSWRIGAAQQLSFGNMTTPAIAGISTVDYSGGYPDYYLVTYTNSIEISGLDTDPIIIGEPVAGWSVTAEVTARTELDP